jgi:hypothetical protein
MFHSNLKVRVFNRVELMLPVFDVCRHGNKNVRKIAGLMVEVQEIQNLVHTPVKFEPVINILSGRI